VRPFSEEKRGTKRGGSTVPEADAIAKSGMVTGEVKGGDWRLEVEDYQRKLGR
jgi:subtilisin-like proprotein convertase family protein